MKLSELSDYTQVWCHRGFSNDEVSVRIGESGKEVALKDIKIERDNESNVIKLIFIGEQ